MRCPQCGTELSSEQASCLACLASPPTVRREAAPLRIVYPGAQQESQPAPPPLPPLPPPPPPPFVSTAPPPPPPAPPSPDAWGKVGAPPITAPTRIVAPVEVSVPASTFPDTGAPSPHGSKLVLVLVGAGLAMLLAAGVAVLAVRGNDDSSASPVDDDVVAVSTTQLQPPTSTVAPVTDPPTTTTVVATTTTTPSAAAVPTVPAVVPLRGPGSPQVLSDPLPSGASYAQVASSFAVAQQLADALALDDWNSARRLEPRRSALSDQQFVDGYTGLDRASLMLVDARAEGAGYRLLVVSVANEKDGSRTSLYCLEWSVDPLAGTVQQQAGAVGLVQRVDVAVSPEGVRNDPGLDGAVRSTCVWS